MRRLIEECDGFLHRCEETGYILFTPTKELPGLWRHQDHLAEIDRAKPFGFFYDASRPDWREKMRDPTPEEHRMLETTNQRPKTHYKGLARRLRDLFS